MKMHKINFSKLKTREEKRQYALKYVTDKQYIKLLEFEKINNSTIEIAFKLFLGEEIIF